MANPSPPPFPGAADVILHGGQVLTMGAALGRAAALAIAGDRVAAVGSDAEVLALAGGTTRLIDLQGRTVVPGFIDTHAHLDREGLRRAYPDLQGCRSITDVQAIVRREAAARRPGEWIVLLPLGEPPFHAQQAEALAEGRFPDRHDLDQAAPHNPVWLRAIWGYWNYTPPFTHVLNSAALAACGITRDTQSPVSTLEIERNAAGEPTGRILEHHIMPAAEFTLLRGAPPFDHDVRRAALARAMQLSVAAGTTGIYEGHGIGREVYQVYRELHERGEHAVRAYLPISPPPWGSLAEAERDLAEWGPYFAGAGLGDAWLKVGGLFLNYGGHRELAAVAARAWPATGWAGFLDQYHDPEEYRQLCRLAARHRLRVNTSIGTDLDPVLTTWEDVDREHPIRDLRWVLVHGRVMEPARDFPRIKRLGLAITTQPASYIYFSGLARVRAGADEDQLLAHRDYLGAGLPWSLSTDNKPYAMLFTLWAAVARRERLEGRVLGPRQRVTAHEALRAMTAAGAYLCFDEHQRGALEPGKLADLVVLSADPLRASEEELKALQVDLTMVDGVVRHERR